MVGNALTLPVRDIEMDGFDSASWRGRLFLIHLNQATMPLNCETEHLLIFFHVKFHFIVRRENNKKIADFHFLNSKKLGKTRSVGNANVAIKEFQIESLLFMMRSTPSITLKETIYNILENLKEKMFLEKTSKCFT